LFQINLFIENDYFHRIKILNVDAALADILFKKDLITPSENENAHLEKPLSVHWDLRSLLYLGILLTTTAAGILIYKNIDTIGHDAMLVATAALMIVCFAYCF